MANRLLFHERDAVGGGSPYVFNRPSSIGSGSNRDLAGLARRMGRAAEPRVQALVGEAHADDVVSRQLIERVTEGIGLGTYPPIAGSLLRLNIGVNTTRRATIGLDIAGRDGVIWEDEDDTGPHPGERFIFRQALSIGGGTVEMQRNLISERLMGMPRESAADRDVPFSEVRRGPAA